MNVILCGAVVKQLNELRAYDVLKCPETSSEVVVNAVTTRSMSHQGQTFNDQSTMQRLDGKLSDDDDDETLNVAGDDMMSYVLFSTHGDGSVTVNNSARDALIAEQQNDQTLSNLMIMAKQNKGHLYFKNGLLYHKDQVLGHNVEQLCLPHGRRLEVCSLPHDMCHQGHRKTKEKYVTISTGLTWLKL